MSKSWQMFLGASLLGGVLGSWALLPRSIELTPRQFAQLMGQAFIPSFFEDSDRM